MQTRAAAERASLRHVGAANKLTRVQECSAWDDTPEWFEAQFATGAPFVLRGYGLRGAWSRFMEKWSDAGLERIAKQEAASKRKYCVFETADGTVYQQDRTPQCNSLIS